MQDPHIPVGGRLQNYIHNWEKITNDQWVLDTIKNGLKIEFMQIPKFAGIKQTRVHPERLNVLLGEVETLLEKGVIEPVPTQEIQEGFYSTFFLVTKKNGQVRPVINLKPLNAYVRKQHFKMDTLAKVLNLVKPNMWAISLDLKDAYLHVPIHKNHRKYLRFCINNKCYQFTAMCFGPTQAPRAFTKITSVVTAYLRMQDVTLASYLDDWLMLNFLIQILLEQRDKTLNLLMDLGFIINLDKSFLVPSQIFTYIGCLFNLALGTVQPTLDRIQKLELAIHQLVGGKITARHYLHILGIMASCIELIPYARLQMRPMQLHLLAAWKPSSRNLESEIPVTQHLAAHVAWWLDRANTQKGRSVVQDFPSITITTDASKHGYGGYINHSQVTQGVWSQTEQSSHINLLEMEAVLRTLKHFLPLLKNQSVMIRCDNITVVQFLNNFGGTKSAPLCYKTWELWHLAIQNNIRLKAAYLAGHLNTLADQLSRVKIQPTEWSLNNQVTQSLFQIWGDPQIDLFASVLNHKAPMFCSWQPHFKAIATDALSISWNRMIAYAFPPICLIPKVLEHMTKFNCQIILIAPQWPRRLWYNKMLQMLIDFPRRLPHLENLLYQPKTEIVHPKPEVFNLVAWLLSTETSKQKAFRKRLENCSLHHGEWAHSKTMLANSKSSVAGVIEGKLIPIHALW